MNKFFAQDDQLSDASEFSSSNNNSSTKKKNFEYGAKLKIGTRPKAFINDLVA